MLAGTSEKYQDDADKRGNGENKGCKDTGNATRLDHVECGVRERLSEKKDDSGGNHKNFTVGRVANKPHKQ